MGKTRIKEVGLIKRNCLIHFRCQFLCLDLNISIFSVLVEIVLNLLVLFLAKHVKCV
jgi:hypothetical protein